MPDRASILWAALKRRRDCSLRLSSGCWTARVSSSVLVGLGEKHVSPPRAGNFSTARFPFERTGVMGRRLQVSCLPFQELQLPFGNTRAYCIGRGGNCNEEIWNCFDVYGSEQF